MIEDKLPQDVYSQMLSRLKDHPESIAPAPTTIDLITYLGHNETWIVRTIRLGGNETVFVQRISAAGGMREVLPPEVAAAFLRQHEAAVGVSRRRGAAKATATKRAKKGTK